MFLNPKDYKELIQLAKQKADYINSFWQLTDKSIDDSFNLGCSFWKCKYSNIYKTNYDFIVGKRSDEMDYSLLFNSKSHYAIVICNELLNNLDAIEYIIKTQLR